jgi:membrane-associated phospholipid phosphatase
MPRNLNEYTGCFTGKKPEFCKELKWYESQPSQCVHCIDVKLFKYLYIDPKGTTTDPDTGEVKPNSRLYDFLTNIQEPLDSTMEFMQLYLFIIVLSISIVFAFFYGIITRGRIPNEAVRSDLAVDAIGFGNGLFPRLIFAIVFSYIVEGIIKLSNYRARPNLTRGVVSDYDRWMGPNDFTDFNDEEERNFFVRSKGALLGLRGHRSSFPSGHNTGAWTLFFILFFSPMYTDFRGSKQPWGKLMSVLAIIFFVLAIYQFYARISLGGWHWPSDIAAGVLLGMVSALFGGLLWSKPGLLILAVGSIVAMFWYFNYGTYQLASALEEYTKGDAQEISDILKNYWGITLVDNEGIIETVKKKIHQGRRAANFFSAFCAVITLLYFLWVYKAVKNKSVGLGPGSYAYLCTFGLIFILFASVSIGFLYPDEMIVSTSNTEKQHWGRVEDLNLGDSSAIIGVAVDQAIKLLFRDYGSVDYGWFQMRLPMSFPIRNLDPLFKKMGALPNAIQYDCRDLGVSGYESTNKYSYRSVWVYAQSYWENQETAKEIAIKKCENKQTVYSEEVNQYYESANNFQATFWWYVEFALVVLLFLYMPRYWGNIYNAQKYSSQSKGWFLYYFLFNSAMFLLFFVPCIMEITLYESKWDKITTGPGWAWFLGPISFLFFCSALVALLSRQGIIPPEGVYNYEENKDMSLLRFLRAQE